MEIKHRTSQTLELLFGEDEIAECLSLPALVVKKAFRSGRGPRGILIEGYTRYTRAAIVDWIDELSKGKRSESAG